MIYETLDMIRGVLATGLDTTVTVGRPAKANPQGMYAWVEPVDLDETDAADYEDYATSGMLMWRVQVRIDGLDLQDKMQKLCNYVDRTKAGSVQRALMNSSLIGVLTILGSSWGIDPETTEFGSNVRGTIIL